jgi:uncharacterized protein YjbI with pentapeptide repeats
MYFGNVNLSGSDLSGANLTIVAMKDVDLSGSNLEGIKYDKITLLSLAGSNLEGAKMSADLQKDLEAVRSGLK